MKTQNAWLKVRDRIIAVDLKALQFIQDYINKHCQSKDHNKENNSWFLNKINRLWLKIKAL